MKGLIILLLGGLLGLISIGGCAERGGEPIGVAVEFNNHAAGASISRSKGWFEAEGLKLSTYESYVTGMALASALARGDIEVAYICLVPAINVYANAGVPVKIVAGTHKYGYGLVVNPDRIKTAKDLEKPDIRLGCVREGGTVDVVLHKIIDKYSLDEGKVINNIQRMNPSQQVLAVKAGQLDAVLLPEHWATMAEEFGFKTLLMSQDIWPGMQGSVLLVKENLVSNHSQEVAKLVMVTQKATDWLNEHPQEAAEVVAAQLNATGGKAFPAKIAGEAARLVSTPEVMLHSMGALEYTTSIDLKVVQETIDYMAGLGYIKDSFKAEDILDLRYLKGE